MKILFITLAVFLSMYSVQALTCYSCPQSTTLSGCVTGHTTKSCAVDTGFDHCFTMKTFVTTSQGQQVTYLEKQCGLAFVCNNPDPNFICNSKNTSYAGQGSVMHNCTWRCCTTNQCNNDDIPAPTAPAPAPVPVVPSASLSANNSLLNGSATVVPSTPQTGNTPTTPPGCGASAINKPLCMLTAFIVMCQFALASFKMM